MSEKKTTYAQGLRAVQDWLNTWLVKGAYIAAEDFLVPTEQAASPGPGAPQITSWKIQGYCPVSWTSARKFTLFVELNLQGPGEVWGGGSRQYDRFVTFTGTNTSPDGYRLYLATGP
jgi:hypothetical protein